MPGQSEHLLFAGNTRHSKRIDIMTKKKRAEVLFKSCPLRNDCLTLGVHGCIILVGPVQIIRESLRDSRNLHGTNQNHTTMNTQSKTVIS